MFKKIAVKTSTFMSEHPRLFSVAMGFAITLAVGTAIGMALDPSHHLAFAIGSDGGHGGNANGGNG